MASNPAHVTAYAEGEVREQFVFCFHARIIGGRLRTSSRSKEVAFADSDKLGEPNIHPSVRMRIDQGLAERAAPYVG
ncbi:hypothetical protein [Streptomyces lycii]|uniref:Uncharacterized protein n=1 Tax=Streptomyces lycii TaxID=2654337 RepID=A0ABQ7FCU6_9ACTN|nr:hypothetical protein [Streptomyces lycii]KAF4405529.1 hypothetical protein GCU69_29850 [Streptomyces lycii]